jgi:hypothetical protein
MNMHELDSITPTPLGPEIERRRTSWEPRRPIPDKDRLGRRIIAGVVAFAVFGLAVAVSSGVITDRSTPKTTSDPWSGYGEGWTELPPPPEWRDGAATVWTGSKLLYWGGVPRGQRTDVPAADDGWFFDPTDQQWAPIPSAPVALRRGWGTWTGTEALFWGERDPLQETDTPKPSWSTVLAFDPSASTWRELPPSPHEPEWGGAWTWTGHELVVVGGGRPDSATALSGAALDPIAGSWRAIAEAPAPLSLADAVWTGTEVVAIGSALDAGNHATTNTAIAESYSPAADSWRRLPDAPLSPQASSAVWFDDEIVAWDYGSDSARFLVTEDRWQGLGKLPLDHGECYVAGVAVADAVFAWNCGYPDVWYPATGWFDVTGGPAPDVPVTEIHGSVGAAVAAGSVAVVWQVDTVQSTGGTIVGGSDAPEHIWAWRPAAQPPEPSPPTEQDADTVADNFLLAWAGYQTYLATLATQDVLDRCGSGSDGCSVFAERAGFNWTTGAIRETDPGSFDVTAGSWNGGDFTPMAILTVGPGITADGRDAQLAVTDVRPT